MIDKIKTWRHDLHAHPEMAYQEQRTSALIIRLLKEAGLDVESGIGGTGVVALLKGNQGEGEMIGLRADMDALGMTEQSDCSYKSLNKGVMHGCGHDGHTAMLLGAALSLAENPDFRGTLCFIFQPAEENRAGAQAMIRDGLFTKYPIDRIFSLHNWPDLPVGHAAVHTKAVMAASDYFDIDLYGRGGHAAMPDSCKDSILAAAQIIQTLQGVQSREKNPFKPAVLSISQIHGGERPNVIPEHVSMKGTCRSYDRETQQLMERRLNDTVDAISRLHGIKGELQYRKVYPPTINHTEEAALCQKVLEEVLGKEKVHTDLSPSACAEDFSFMLREKPGAYIWLGSGSAKQNQKLHSPAYDFNDDTLEYGLKYWLELVKVCLT